MELKSEQIVAIMKHRFIDGEVSTYYISAKVVNFIAKYGLFDYSDKPITVYNENNEPMKLKYDPERRMKMPAWFVKECKFEAGDILLVIIINEKIFFVSGK